MKLFTKSLMDLLRRGHNILTFLLFLPLICFSLLVISTLTPLSRAVSYLMAAAILLSFVSTIMATHPSFQYVIFR